VYFTNGGDHMASYLELKEQAETLLRQAETARKAEISSAIADIKAKMAAYGITVEDLGVRGRKGRKLKSAKPAKSAGTAKGKVKAKAAKPRKPVAAKFRNEATGETWSGRGKAPKWLVAMEAGGRKREEFAVA
jgi:DNA-binding protein H-NS